MATATSKLQIIVDVLGDEAAGKLKGIEANLSKIAVVTGTVVAAGYAAKQAWDFGKEGAQLELTAGRFKNVAENAGYLSDVLLNEMRKATGGMVTDAELMASGLQIIELGLAGSQKGVVDLATTVSVLGLDMQMVIQTFANDSELRLDSLGLSVEGVQNRVKELKAEGFVGDAFDQAVLEGLIERTEVYGDVTETTAGQMQLFETSLENVTNEAKTSLASVWGPIVTKINDSRQSMELLTQAYDQGLIELSDYVEYQFLLRTGLGNTDAILFDLNKRFEDHALVINRAALEASDADMVMGRYSTTLAYSSSMEQFYGEQSAAAAQSTYEFADSIESAESVTSTYNQRLQAAAGSYSTLSTNIYSVTQRLQDNLEFINAGGLALVSLAQTAEDALDEGDFEGASLALDAAAQGAVDLDLELGNIDPEEAVQRLMDLGLGPKKAKAKVAEFEASLFAVTTRRWIVNVDMVVSQSGSLPPGVTVPGIDSGGGSGGGTIIGDPAPKIQSTGFGDTGGDIFIDTVVVVTDNPTDFTVKLKRDAQSAAAGSGYVG